MGCANGARSGEGKIQKLGKKRGQALSARGTYEEKIKVGGHSTFGKKKKYGKKRMEVLMAKYEDGLGAGRG